MKFKLIESLDSNKNIKLYVPVLIETTPPDNIDYKESKQFIDDIKKNITYIKTNIVMSLNQNKSYIKNVNKLNIFNFKYSGFEDPYLVFDFEVDEFCDEKELLKTFKRYFKQYREIYNAEADQTTSITVLNDKLSFENDFVQIEE